MPKIYGIEHVLYLIFFIACTVGIVWAVKKYAKEKRQAQIALFVLAGMQLVILVINRISLAVWHDEPLRLIPDSFCGLTSLIFPLAIFFIKDKNHCFFHGVFYIALVNPIVTMVYPDFLGQNESFFFLPTISGMLHHSLCIINSILLLSTKMFTPDLKKWWCFWVALVSYVTYGLFIMQCFGVKSAMYLTGPIIEGSKILIWYYVGIMMAVLHLAFLFVFENMTNKHKALKTDKKEDAIK